MLGEMRRGVLRVAIGGRHVSPLPLPPACRLLAALHRSGLTRRVGLHLEVSEQVSTHVSTKAEVGATCLLLTGTCSAW